MFYYEMCGSDWDQKSSTIFDLAIKKVYAMEMHSQ